MKLWLVLNPQLQLASSRGPVDGHVMWQVRPSRECGLKLTLNFEARRWVGDRDRDPGGVSLMVFKFKAICS